MKTIEYYTEQAKKLMEILNEKGEAIIRERMEYLKNEHFVDALYWKPSEIKELAKCITSTSLKRSIATVLVFTDVSNFVIFPLIRANYLRKEFSDFKGTLEETSFRELFKKEEMALLGKARKQTKDDQLEIASILKAVKKERRNA